MREHVFQGWPIAAGEPVLGKALPKRRLHSLVTASRETGIPRERLRAMLVSQDIVPARGSGTIPAWELFDAASTQGLLTRMDRSIPLAETLTKLNITRSQMETLRTAGYLQPDFEGEGYAPLWDPMKNDSFIASLTSGSINVPSGDTSWEPIGSAASRLRIRPGDIIASKLRGELEFGRRNGLTGYGALVVRIADVKAMRVSSQDYLNIETFAKQIGIRWPQARRLILLGLTPSTISRNPASGALQSYISPSDLEAFHDRYVTLKTLADERREPWQSVRVWLNDTGTPRIEAEGRDFGSLYERSMLKSG